MEKDRPNFLILMTDQQRGDSLGCAWPAWRREKVKIRTPHLDRLASEGVRLSRHFTNTPLCMPSRATLMTGLSARAHGVRTNGIDLSPAVPTLASALSRAGYLTHSVGKIHHRVFDIPEL